MLSPAQKNLAIECLVEIPWERGHPARIFRVFRSHPRAGCPRSQEIRTFCTRLNVDNVPEFRENMCSPAMIGIASLRSQ
jgi:hypothetical protein